MNCENQKVTLPDIRYKVFVLRFIGFFSFVDDVIVYNCFIIDREYRGTKKKARRSGYEEKKKI